MYSASKKAPAPITGGNICPKVDADASMPPDASGVKPMRFINGIVKVPVVVTVAVELPDMVPMTAEDTMAALAGPPRVLPATAMAKLRKNCPAPVFSKIAPYKINSSTNLADTPKGMPKIPSVVKYIKGTVRAKGNPRCANSGGKWGPTK